MPHTGLIRVSARQPTSHISSLPFPAFLRARQRTLGFPPGPASLLVPIAAGPPSGIEDGPGQDSPARPAGDRGRLVGISIRPARGPTDARSSICLARSSTLRRSASISTWTSNPSTRLRRWENLCFRSPAPLPSSSDRRTGLQRAVAQGTRLGRPKVDVALERKAQKQLKKGVGILRVAKMLGLGTGTVQRIKQEMGAA